jgi:Flp pilus assembly protein TadG
MVAKFSSRTQSRARQAIRNFLCRYVRDRRGNIAAIAALLIVPLVGVMGMATEASSWFLVQRGMQNAADSAVVAAGQNAMINTSGTTYITEGRSVTTKLGFTNGANDTTVNVTKSEACPAPLTGSNCYKVVINRNVPIYMTRLVGYTGTVAMGTGRGQTVAATAIAGPINTPVTNCIFTKGTGSESYRVNGAGGGSIDLNGCNIQSNGGAECNGSNADGNVNHFFVVGTNKDCGPGSSATALTDPYLSIYPRTNIPADTCGSAAASYPQAPTKNKDPELPSSNLLSGTVNIAKQFCGDVKLTGNVTASSGGTMVIQNGSLDLAGHTLQGTGITIIFAGPTVPSLSPGHRPPQDGTLDIAAPKSGTWSGVAIYQDPNITSNVDWSSSGIALNWNVTGLIYMPNSDISFKGNINKATGGENCFTMVAKTVLFSGTVDINETQTGCDLAGLTTLPTSYLPRISLVQ